MQTGEKHDMSPSQEKARMRAGAQGLSASSSGSEVRRDGLQCILCRTMDVHVLQREHKFHLCVLDAL